MAHNSVLTKVLAVTGTVLAWFPILATVLLSIAGSLESGMFRLDYLMPAELFPAAFAGGLLLLWAALRARARRALIGGGVGAMLALLVGGQALAVVTGLATGEIEPVGLPWALVMAAIAGYALALVVIGCGGVLLARDLFGRNKSGLAGGPASS